MTLYEKILAQFHMPNAFEDWKEYRESLTQYLIDETNTYPIPLTRLEMLDTESIKPTLLVVGAGACNDLDLAALSSHFSCITLLDSDEEALQAALEKYQLTDATHIHLQIESLNGITASHYEDFCDHLLTLCNTLTGNELATIFPDYACHLLEEYYDKVRDYTFPIANDKYDYVWCVGVHSQLQSLFSYIYNIFEQEIHTELGSYDPNPTGNNRFHKFLREQNQFFIPKLNDALLDAAAYKCILGFEAYRTNADYEVLPELNSTLIEGAYQGIEDIRKRKIDCNSQYIFWPFAPANQQYYEMQIETIETKQA